MSFNEDTNREHKDRIQKITKVYTYVKLGVRIDKRTDMLEIIKEKIEMRYVD